MAGTTAFPVPRSSRRGAALPRRVRRASGHPADHLKNQLSGALAGVPRVANAVIRGSTRLVGLGLVTVSAMWLLRRLFSPSFSWMGEAPFPDESVAPSNDSDELSETADALSMKRYDFPDTQTDPRENF